MKIGFIGLGNMASAMIGGMIAKNIVKKEDLFGADALSNAADRAKEQFGIGICTDNKEVVEKAEVIVLSVKPQFYETVISEIGRASCRERV